MIDPSVERCEHATISSAVTKKWRRTWCTVCGDTVAHEEFDKLAGLPVETSPVPPAFNAALERYSTCLLAWEHHHGAWETERLDKARLDLLAAARHAEKTPDGIRTMIEANLRNEPLHPAVAAAMADPPYIEGSSSKTKLPRCMFSAEGRRCTLDDTHEAAHELESQPLEAPGEPRRWEFDRYHYGKLKAQGIVVRAHTLDEALSKALELREDNADTLELRPENGNGDGA